MICFEETRGNGEGKLEQNPIRLEYDHLGLRYIGCMSMHVALKTRLSAATPGQRDVGSGVFVPRDIIHVGAWYCICITRNRLEGRRVVSNI